MKKSKLRKSNHEVLRWYGIESEGDLRFYFRGKMENGSYTRLVIVDRKLATTMYNRNYDRFASPESNPKLLNLVTKANNNN